MKNYSMSKRRIVLRSVLFLCLTALMTIFITGCPVAADEEPVLLSIYISNNPDKMEYQLNEPLDLTGMEVKALYSDGSIKTVEEWSSNPKQGTELNTIGEVKVKVTYQRMNASLKIWVYEQQEKHPSSIYISKKPDKLSYEYKDALDLSGIEVKAIYSDGSEETIENWTSDLSDGTILTISGNVTVIISYGYNISTSFIITVAEKPLISANEYFWGTWVRMDNGKEYEVLETSVVLYNQYYDITASDSNSLSVSELGTFTKQSDSVMLCNNIPYFRKGGANLEYSLKLVGFTSNGRAAGTSMGGIKGKGKSLKYSNFESNSESDTDGNIKFIAPTAYDTQTVEIESYDDELPIVVQGLKIKNNGDFMGTIALVGKKDYNLKITGEISDDQKDNGYLYGNNAKTYEMILTITNISENECSSSGCIVKAADPNLKIESKDPTINLEGFSNPTMIGGAKREIKLSLVYGEMTKPYVDTGINVTITNPFTNQEWSDYIPLRFFKGTIPITIAAKNSMPDSKTSLNGFVIYPDGNNQFFEIPNNSCKAVFIPTFGSEKPYKLVFSGATVTTELSENSEMYYTVEPASLTPRTVVTGVTDEVDFAMLMEYMTFGGENHTEDDAFSVNNDEGFEAYLRKGEIDYYSIKADSDIYYGPGGTTFYSVSYLNEKGSIPDTFLTTEGAVLSTIQLPEMKRDGYKFLGWYSGTTKVIPGAFSVNDNVTLTAKWQLDSYSIVYELNGGTNNAANPSAYTIESSAITLAKPVKNGYDFAGWFISEDFSGSAVEAIGGGTIGGITLYAKWTPVLYKITYELDDGTNAVSNPATYTIETAAITLAAPQKKGFAFDGWYADSSFTGSLVTTIEKGSTGDKTYYAKWLKECKVQYETVRGTAPEAIIIGEGQTFTAEQLPELTSSDYFFSGWYVGETRVTAGSYTVTDDVTLKAKWSDKCTVSYVTAHGTAPEAFTVESGTTLTAEKLPSLKEKGWKFLGWYTSSSYDEDKKASAGQIVTKSITLYAKWEEFTGLDDGFVFVEGGTVVGSSSYKQNQTGTFPAGRTVTLSSFYMSDHELTQGEYETYCCYTEDTPSSNYGVGADYPAYYVSWYDAIVYCNLKSMAEGLTPCYTLSGETDPRKWTGIKSSNGKYSCSYTGSNSNWNSVSVNIMTANGYRLPTEAEWEYAARGGQVTYGTDEFAYYFAGAATTNYSSSSNSDLDSVGWYLYNICNNGVTGSEASSGSSGYGAHEVKTKVPNALGLYDMSGNVWEWCWDWYPTVSLPSGSVTNPGGYTSGTYRLFHGGSWGGSANYCSVSYQGYNNPYYRNQCIGFRLVRSALYTITYSTAHGTTPQSFDIRGGKTLTTEDLPELNENGCVFGGWYLDSAYTQKVEAGYAISDSITLYAKWTELYDLTYSTLYGTQPSAQNVEEGQILTAADLPQLSATGYNFLGWYDGEDKIEEGYKIAGDLVLTAKWELEKYKINYNTNGGKKNPNNASTYTIDDEVVLLPASYSGDQYTFAGWFLNPDFTTKITKIERGTTGEITLYARWGEPASVTVALPEYNDIEMSYVEDGNYLTFTGTEGFSNYEWQIDGSKMKSTRNTLIVDVSGWSSGRHVIILTAKDKDSGQNRTATVYITK